MQQIANYGHDTAENILWHPQENALYWLDIPAGKMFRGHFPHLQEEELERFESSCILQMDEPIGGFVFCKTRISGQARFLLFASEGRIYQWTYDPSSMIQETPELYFQVDLNLVPARFNDVFALPFGRFVLCGTMPSDGNADSRLLLLDVNQRCIQLVQQNLKLANGMGLSGGFLYFADTRDFAVYRFPVKDLRQADINWTLREKQIDFHSRPGRPDGLCLDQDGCIWLAETGAGIVTCFAADGQELGCLKVGTPKVTSCCFGGSAKQILFVSTQGGEGMEGPAGGIFAQKAVPPFPYFCGQEEALIENKLW